MSRLTADPNDPQLTRGIDKEQVDQAKAYLVLSKEEIAKGFIRPVRDKYIHVGKKIERDEEGRIIGRLIKIDDPDYPKHGDYIKEKGYGGYIEYPKSKHPRVGRYLEIKEVEAIVDRKKYFGGCEGETKMSWTIAETYARDPKFYGATYCIHCKRHIDVNEFVWSNTNEIVGS